MAVHKNAINIMTTIARPESGQEVTKYTFIFRFYNVSVGGFVFLSVCQFLLHTSGSGYRFSGS